MEQPPKTSCSPLAAALLAACGLYPAPRALQAAHPLQIPPPPVPVRWTVETSRAQVAQFEAYRGETLLLEAEMRSYGKPLSEVLQPDLYWQTNGMGNAWWKAPATSEGNVCRAFWTPTNDCGAAAYNCFIGGPGATYRAAFRLRMLPSPGFTPNHLPLPARRIDFAAVELENAPWATRGDLADGLAGKADADAVYTRAQADARFFQADEGAQVWSFLTAENFSVVVTNYGSAATAPSVTYRYRQSTNDPWRVVWTETNGLARVLAAATNLAARAAARLDAEPANRAWGRYDSQTGEAAPEGVVQVSAPAGLLIGGGMGWSQIAADGGSYWLLTSSDPVLCAVGTNGVLSIVGSDGEEAIKVVKGDRRVVPAPASGIVKAPGLASVTYTVVSDAHPTAEFSTDLCGPWFADGDPHCPASFSWSGSSGAWTLTLTTPGDADGRGFIRAAYETGGESYTAFGGGGVEVRKIVVGGVPYIAGTSRIDGKTVLTLTPSAQ